MLNRCQEEFESNNDNRWSDGDESEKPVSQMTDEEVLEYSKRQAERTKKKRRSLGNIRFIGELYMCQMITQKIIRFCFWTLFNNLKNPDEESVECLCFLFRTVGNKVENQLIAIEKGNESLKEWSREWNRYFNDMTLLSKNKSFPSRMRFMLMDIIELRKNKWKSKDTGPKTIAEIHKEAEKELKEQEVQRNNSRSGSGRSNSNRSERRSRRSESMRESILLRANQNKLDKGELNSFGKLEHNNSMNNQFLGPQGSKNSRLNKQSNSRENSVNSVNRQSTLATVESPLKLHSNLFEALNVDDHNINELVNEPEEIPEETPKEIPEETPKEIPEETPKETQKEIPDEIPDEITDEIPDEITDEITDEIPDDLSDEIPDESEKKSEKTEETSKKKRIKPKEKLRGRPKGMPKMEEEKAKIRIENTFREYVSQRNYDEAVLSIKEIGTNEYDDYIVRFFFNYYADANMDVIKAATDLVIKLIRRKLLAKKNIRKELQDIAEFIEDMTFDIPNVYRFHGYFLARMIAVEILNFKDLEDVCKLMKDCREVAGTGIPPSAKYYGYVVEELFKLMNEKRVLKFIRDDKINFKYPWFDKIDIEKLTEWLEFHHLDFAKNKLETFSNLKKKLGDIPPDEMIELLLNSFTKQNRESKQFELKIAKMAINKIVQENYNRYELNKFLDNAFPVMETFIKTEEGKIEALLNIEKTSIKKEIEDLFVGMLCYFKKENFINEKIFDAFLSKSKANLELIDIYKSVFEEDDDYRNNITFI